jgi:hypothetical protein
MVRRKTKFGGEYHEPPYTQEEIDDFYRRISGCRRTRRRRLTTSTAASAEARSPLLVPAHRALQNRIGHQESSQHQSASDRRAAKRAETSRSQACGAQRQARARHPDHPVGFEPAGRINRPAASMPRRGSTRQGRRIVMRLR